MSSYPPTPRITDHARKRCVEMGLTTKRVKRVVRSSDLDYVAHDGRRVVCRRDEPTFRVVVANWSVVTVLPWSYEDYERAS